MAGTSTRRKAKVEKVMHEFKTGTLHSGRASGPRVRSRKQAIAIALSESGQSRRKTRTSSSSAARKARKRVSRKR